MEISIVIPTYGRNRVLVETVASLLSMMKIGHEIIIVDQSLHHEPETERMLNDWFRSGKINWLKSSPPSITVAMNMGLRNARGGVVLFLDDDIEPASGLIEAHLEGHKRGQYAVVAGRVIQPWKQDESSNFYSNRWAEVDEFMGGNFSVDRAFALAVRGFDQNFRFAAYQFERDFADRVQAAGGRILYWPTAAINHLKASEGGVRSYGTHLTTWHPGHSLGAYYYIQTTGRHRVQRTLNRLFRSIFTRFHLTHPWYVPLTLVAEVSGLVLASLLWRKGPNLITQTVEI